MNDKEKMLDEVMTICKVNLDNLYCDKFQLIDMIRDVLELYENYFGEEL